MSNEKKSKFNISPEAVDKASEKMGEIAEKTDNLYTNVKEKLGPMGKAIGFGVLITFVFALIHSPGLVWVLALMIALGSAPMLRKKYLEVKALGEAHAAKKKAEADEKARKEAEALLSKK
jgi:tetrahydromethanopterin S-methyltransferase subunit G